MLLMNVNTVQNIEDRINQLLIKYETVSMFNIINLNKLNVKDKHIKIFCLT